MNKRAIADLFRQRLTDLMARNGGTAARFSRLTGVDRSALSQFLDPEQHRLPRADTLRRISEATSVPADWLLGLANSPEAGQEVRGSVQIELAMAEDGHSPLDRWRREAEGGKIRYVPAVLPDVLRHPTLDGYGAEPERDQVLARQGQSLLSDVRIGDLDMEICMPRQELEALAEGSGVWSVVSRADRVTQLQHMAELVEASYPTVRLHLFDLQNSFCAPLTVFAMKRAAIYLGHSYLVVTASEQVRALARHFDRLVRECASADETHLVLDQLATRAANPA